MESKTKLLGHPVHPMLIVFPLGLLAGSLIFDFIYLGTANAQWAQCSFWMIAAGVIGGLLAGVFGLIDWLAVPSYTRAKAIGAWHGIGNGLVVALFAASWLLRRADPAQPDALPIVLSGIAVLLALVTGWLGGELVDRLGVGVDDGANLNASSSLTGQSAHIHSAGGLNTHRSPWSKGR
jgi:uncharacterized membrane protein